MKKTSQVSIKVRAVRSVFEDCIRPEYFQFESKARILEVLLAGSDMPVSLPSRRETEIQVQKLLRMAKKFENEFPWRPSTKALNRQRAPIFQKLYQQDKHVDSLVRKLLREQMKARHSLRSLSKHDIARVEEVMKFMNKSIHEQTVGRMKAATDFGANFFVELLPEGTRVSRGKILLPNRPFTPADTERMYSVAQRFIPASRVKQIKAGAP
jgi:hypothetical protein